MAIILPVDPQRGTLLGVGDAAGAAVEFKGAGSQ